MNILHLSPYLPSLSENHAGGVCMGKEVETLKKKHNVYVLSFIVTDLDWALSKSLSEPEYCLHTMSDIKRLINVLSHFWLPPLFAARSSRQFQKDIDRLIRLHNIQAVHGEYASMGQYLLYIKKRYPHIKCTLVEHDFTEQSYDRKADNANHMLLRFYYQLQRRQIGHYERKYCTAADFVLTFNDKDFNLITNTYHLTNVRTLAPYYGLDTIESEKKTEASIHLCFVGQMGRKENSSAALRLFCIFQKVKERIPQLTMSIIGSNPPSILKEKQSPSVQITGYIEDIDAEIRKCQLGVFPLMEGAGIKLKVLRCLALGVPVITTPVGAEGIDETGRIIKIATTDDEFAASIIQSLSNTEALHKQAQKGIDFINSSFSWNKSQLILDEIYEETYGI